MTTLICSRCAKPLELMLRSNIVDPVLDQWNGITLPAARSMLKEYGVIA